MSLMNMAEKKARYSFAFDTLNKVRQNVEQTNTSSKTFDQLDKDIMKSLLDLFETDDKSRLVKIVLYGFNNINKTAQATALQIYESLNSILREDEPLKKDFVIGLKQLLTNSEISNPDKIKNVVLKGIDLMSQRKFDELKNYEYFKTY